MKGQFVGPFAFGGMNLNQDGKYVPNEIMINLV